MKRFQVGLVVCSVVALPWLSGTSFAQAATDVVCTQCVSSSDLANDSIGSAKIKDGTLASNDLAASAVKAANINAGAVTLQKLAPSVRGKLDGALANITFEPAFNVEESVTSVECPSETFAVSASCICDNEEGARNFGVLFGCVTVGTGVVAGCFTDGTTFDPQLPPPNAQVQAACMGATTSDGTPWVPFPEGLAPVSSNSNDAANSSERQAQWHKAQYDAYKAALVANRKKAAARDSRLWKR